MIKIISSSPSSPELDRYVAALQANDIPYRIVPFDDRLVGKEADFLVVDELCDVRDMPL